MSWRYRAFIPKEYQKEFMHEAMMNHSMFYNYCNKIIEEVKMNRSKREEAKKIKQYMITFTDVPITVHDGYFIRIGDREGVSCRKGNTVYWDDCKWVVSQFLFGSGYTRDVCIIEGQVAKYARLRPDNGVKEVSIGGVRSVRYGSTKVSFTHDGQNYLDRIINRREEKWVKVLYNDGKVILFDERGYVGLAKHRGQHVTMPSVAGIPGTRYEIVGYTDNQILPHNASVPIVDSHAYSYCLLQEV